MKVNIDDSELRKFERDLTKLVNEQGDYVASAMIRSVQDVTNTAKTKTPVVTGTLRRSITYNLQNRGYTGISGTNLSYAPFIEFGKRQGKRGLVKRKRGPALFMQTGLDKNKATIEKRFSDLWAGKIIKKIKNG